MYYFDIMKFIKNICRIDIIDILITLFLFSAFGCDFIPFVDISWKMMLFIWVCYHIVCSLYNAIEKHVE